VSCNEHIKKYSVARLQHEPSDLHHLRGVLPPPGTGPVSGAKAIALKTGIKRIANADPIDNDLVLIPGRHVPPATLPEDKDALNFLQLPEPSPTHGTATHRWASDTRSGPAFWWSHMWIYFAGPPWEAGSPWAVLGSFEGHQP
jgi:hypothetical protein